MTPVLGLPRSRPAGPDRSGPARAGRPGPRRLLSAVGAALTCVTLAGCAPPISGVPTVSGGDPSAEVAGLPAVDGPSGTRAEAPEPTVPVRGADGRPADRLAARAVEDVQEYWAEQFPETFDGAGFTPMRGFVSFDATGRGVPFCGKHMRTPNAFYCAAEDRIAWDRGELLPGLRNSFGPMGVVAVLAHETGHAVQRRAGTTERGTPMIVREQQADCFTGSYFRWVAEGDSRRFRMSTGDGLNQVLGVLNYIRDAPGQRNFTDGRAHGSAFDRITAFQQGFTGGPERCTAMDERSVRERTTQFANWKDGQDEDLPVDRRSLQRVWDSLQAVFHDTAARPPQLTTDLAECAPATSDAAAAYCPGDDVVAVDLERLGALAQQPDGNAGTAGYGDFAAYAQVASRYALSVQQAAGMPVRGERAGLRTACFVGGWSGLLMEDPIGQRNPVGRLRVAPGDIDEGVAALLSRDGLIAADADGEQATAGFARVEAFRTGFQGGFSACGAKYRA
ncbi:neutral zinc metallopeptidase [Salinifilum ghardaiensis]